MISIESSLIRNEVVHCKKKKWILCPVCNNKTRLRIREDTEIKNFPLYCPKCKQENLINVKNLNISVITEPDALALSVL